MRFLVEIYYKGGGTGKYPVSALDADTAKRKGRELSMKWEPKLAIVKVTAKKVVEHVYNQANPFGNPADNTEDLASHPRSARFA